MLKVSKLNFKTTKLIIDWNMSTYEQNKILQVPSFLLYLLLMGVEGVGEILVFLF